MNESWVPTFALASALVSVLVTFLIGRELWRAEGRARRTAWLLWTLSAWFALLALGLIYLSTG